MEIFFKTKPDTIERVKECLINSKRNYNFLIEKRELSKGKFIPTKQYPKFVYGLNSEIRRLKIAIKSYEDELNKS